MNRLSSYTTQQLDMAIELAILEGKIRLNGKEIGKAIKSHIDPLKLIDLADNGTMLRGMFCRLMKTYRVLYGE